MDSDLLLFKHYCRKFHIIVELWHDVTLAKYYFIICAADIASNLGIFGAFFGGM